jgi:hypothetical protein
MPARLPKFRTQRGQVLPNRSLVSASASVLISGFRWIFTESLFSGGCFDRANKKE